MRWFRRRPSPTPTISRHEIERLCFEQPEMAADLLEPYGLSVDDVRRWDQPFPSHSTGPR